VPARLCIAPCVLRVKAPQEAWRRRAGGRDWHGRPGPAAKAGPRAEGEGGRRTAARVPGHREDARQAGGGRPPVLRAGPRSVASRPRTPRPPVVYFPASARGGPSGEAGRRGRGRLPQWRSVSPACLHRARLCVAAEYSRAAAAALTCAHVCAARGTQVVDELFSYWTLEASEDTLEALEEALIVRPPRAPPPPARPPAPPPPPRRAPLPVL